MTRSNNTLRQILHNSKKTIVMMALVLTASISYSFAAPTNGIDDAIKITLQKDFKNAQFISSEAHKNFTKVTFSMNKNVFFAFYASTGELLAVTRNILSSQLPINLMMSLRNDYKGWWITELFELNGDGENGYYVSLENADSKMILRSTSDNTWEVYKETFKN
jgi:hypothetical protein